MAFPSSLTSAIDGGTEIMASHLNNLEAKVGVDGSSVATSLDYKITNTSSTEPGHKHTKLWSSDGSQEAITLDINSNVGINSSNFGVSAENTLCIGNGTAPVDSPIDTTQLWSANRGGVSGKAGLHIRTEDGTKHVFSDYCGLATFTPTILLDAKGKIGFATDGSTYWATAVRFTAATTITQGTVVANSTAANDTVIKVLPNSELPSGIALETANTGNPIWVAVGGVALVQFKTDVVPKCGQVAFVSSVTGYASCVTTISSATAATHWRKIGNICSTGATGGQARVLLHFN